MRSCWRTVISDKQPVPQSPREVLATVFASYDSERLKPLKGSSFARWFSHDAAASLASILARPDLHFEGSVGQGNWAEVPWFGVFNPESTTSATQGVYVVYLFSADCQSVYLCQGQGVTSVKEEFGRRQKDELVRRAELIRARVPEFSARFSAGPISLGGRTPLAKSYDDAVAYYRRYEFASLPSDDELRKDLLEIVTAYDLLIARGGTDNVETAMLVSGAEQGNGERQTIDEQRRYVRHMKLDRRSTSKVKKALGYVCQACGFDFVRHYGELGREFIEAHHLTPLHLLPEGKVVSLDPLTDFAVLCANCHRMVHRGKDVLPVDVLSQREEVVRLRHLLTSGQG